MRLRVSTDQTTHAQINIVQVQLHELHLFENHEVVVQNDGG